MNVGCDMLNRCLHLIPSNDTPAILHPTIRAVALTGTLLAITIVGEFEIFWENLLIKNYNCHSTKI